MLWKSIVRHQLNIKRLIIIKLTYFELYFAGSIIGIHDKLHYIIGGAACKYLNGNDNMALRKQKKALAVAAQKAFPLK